MDTSCAAISNHIRFLVESLNDTNSDSVLRELCQFIESGTEGSILLLQTCLDYFNSCQTDFNVVVERVLTSVFKGLINGPNFCTVFCESLRNTEVNEGSSKQIQNIVMFLRRSEDLSKHVDSFMEMVLMILHLKDDSLSALNPLFFDEGLQASFLRNVSLFHESVCDDIVGEMEMERSMGGLMKELGYGCTEDSSQCEEILTLIVVPLTEMDVAKILGMIACTHNQNIVSTFILVLGYSTSSDLPILNTSDIDVLVDTINQLAPGTNWTRVFENLDHKEFYIPDQEAFSFFMSVYQHACQEPFPLHAICGSVWKNSEGQLSFLRYAVSAAPAVFSFAHSGWKLPYVDAVRQLGETNHAWLCLDLLDVLCHLAERAGAGSVRPVLKYPLKHCPEILLLGMAHINTPYNLLQYEVAFIVFPMMLKKAMRNDMITHLWQTNPFLLLRGFMEVSSDPESMSKILDACDELKIPGVLRPVYRKAAYELSKCLFNIWNSISAAEGCLNCLGELSNLDVQTLALAETKVTKFKAVVNSALTSTKELIDQWVNGGIEYVDLQEKAQFDLHGGSASSAFNEMSRWQNDVSNSLKDAFRSLSLMKQTEFAILGSVKDAKDAHEVSTVIHSKVNEAKHILMTVQGHIDQMKRPPESKCDLEPKSDPEPNSDVLDVSADDIEADATSSTQLYFSGHSTIVEMVKMLVQYKTSSVERERCIFSCIITKLFEAYKFFPYYHILQLNRAAVLFGSVIDKQLVTDIHLWIALRLVSDSLHKPAESNMFMFGTKALQQFKDRLIEWPSYCYQILHISHLKTDAVIQQALARIWYGHLEFGGSNHASAVHHVRSQPISECVGAPTEIQDKILSIVNNISFANIEVKTKEFAEILKDEILKEEHYPWLAQYMVKSASNEPSFHDLYLGFLANLNSKSLNKKIVAATYEKCKSELMKSNLKERYLLPTLGSWLGKLTIGRNVVLLGREIAPKSLIIEAYEKGSMIAVIPFISKILEPCVSSLAYELPNPWTVGILELLAEIFLMPNLDMNLKADIEAIFVNMNVDFRKITPTSVLKDRNRKLEGNPDFPNKDVGVSQPQMVEVKLFAQDPFRPLGGRCEPYEVLERYEGHDGWNGIQYPSLAHINIKRLSRLIWHSGIPGGIHVVAGGISQHNSENDPDPGGSLLQTLVVVEEPELITELHTLVALEKERKRVIRYHPLTHIMINPTLSSLISDLDFQSAVPVAMDRAINKIPSRIVKDSVFKATKTTIDCVLKDYGMESDDATTVSIAATCMVTCLARCHVHETCKEPLLSSISSQLRNSFEGLCPHSELDVAVQIITDENLDICCAVIEQAAGDEAVAFIDGWMENRWENLTNTCYSQVPGGKFEAVFRPMDEVAKNCQNKLKKCENIWCSHKTFERWDVTYPLSVPCGSSITVADDISQHNSENEPAIESMEPDPDPDGFLEKVSSLWDNWISICNPISYKILDIHPNPESDHFINEQIRSNGLLKGDSITDRFFCLLTELTVNSSLGDEYLNPDLFFRPLASYAKLVFCILKKEEPNIVLLSKILEVTVRFIQKTAVEKRTLFDPRPYMGLFDRFLLYLEPLGCANLQILTVFANAFHALRPLKVPAFSFVWVQLVCHKSFMPKMLIGDSQKGWPHFLRLLLDWFQFMEPFLRNAADLRRPPVRLLCAGILRVLLVLLSDFPEFLCNYHFPFCDVIPRGCIQMRNIILSAFPRNMRLPPLNPNNDFTQLPQILFEVDAALKAKQMKTVVDEFLKTYLTMPHLHTNSSPFLFELKKKLLLLPSEAAAAGTLYNVPLINSLVLYVGMQAIQQIQISIPHAESNESAPLERFLVGSVFQLLMRDLDTEGFYLFLNAIANQLRYPNTHTYYFSSVVLHLFSISNQEIFQEQIIWVLLERLIVKRPHPWGLRFTFIELIKNPIYNFWDRASHFRSLNEPEIRDFFVSISMRIENDTVEDPFSLCRRSLA